MAPRIVLTSGEPAGVGPDLCLAIAARAMPCELVCLADAALLAERARQLGLAVELHPYRPEAPCPHQPGHLFVEQHALAAPCTPGRLEVRNARYVTGLLERACAGALAAEFAAIVTAPVHKGLINEAGVPFTGHTEFFAERTGASPVMMLATGTLRVALATTHLPLARVSEALTRESLCATLAILDQDLRRWWGLARPRIGVCGLNPHAGEGGHLGDEEIRVIGPAIAAMRERGLEVSGPLPADTVFVPRVLARYDAVLAMYHDQGLPVIKHAGFDSAVNVTLGLPILRTSVDHGTALELAGTGRAEPGSLVAALELAVALAKRRDP
ncbi:MAG: 4-hydroxythreonine-4-phosphate dehydrogenase PdxA [Pseudomonadota bacterium]|jgi:4-hydroxythreonine-4-phosphate dehydrogenase|nr:4-hydroxythreonine-4-phosphate dehydrogenase PdxA [Pseudomonadota bacterium]